MTVTIYHNPSCSKSRQTLELIRQKGISAKIIEYLKTDLSKKELQRAVDLLNVDVRDIIRTGDGAYHELGLANESINEDQLLEAIIENPTLLQRPIVIANSKAVIGRPPENVLEIL